MGSAFDPVLKAFAKQRGVTQGTGFGKNPGLRVGGKIFAMMIDGALVVKLPKARVTELVGAGDAEHFDTGSGRLMKEWASVSSGDWVALAQEAYTFVKGS
jgi:hypothetical protein